MALSCNESGMSLDNDLSSPSPCKSFATNTSPTNSEITKEIDTKENAVNKQQQPLEQEASSDQNNSSRSWIEMVKEEEEENENLAVHLNKESKVIDPVMELSSPDSKMSIDDGSSGVVQDESSSKRQIEIDFLDSSNVEKYEKLVRCDKIKSPFKRRFSGGAEEDVNGNGHAKHSEEGADNDEAPQNQNKKSKMQKNDLDGERSRRESYSSGDSSSQTSQKSVEYETDLVVLERRQKQIDYGKNTLGYENYMKQIPREKRTKDHPKTPPKHIKYSRRAWDGLIRVWRRQLHCFDPDADPKIDV